MTLEEAREATPASSLGGVPARSVPPLKLKVALPVPCRSSYSPELTLYSWNEYGVM